MTLSRLRLNRRNSASQRDRRGRTARRAVVLGVLLVMAGGTRLSAETRTIVGRVIHFGQVTEPEVLAPTTAGQAVCGSEPGLSKALRISPSGGVQNAVVSLVHQRIPGWRSSTVFNLDQRRCEFVPRILMVPVGSTVRVHNSDGILHNFHTVSRLNPPMNLAQPGFAKPLRVTFRNPEIVPVKCDLHGRRLMRAWIIVTAHPYYALSDESGSFRMPNVPPGSHVFEVWHEVLGTMRAVVSVAPSGVTNVTMSYPPETVQ